MITIQKAYSYDDVLLVPRYSDVNSRVDIDLSVDMCGLKFNTPIVPANMKDIVSQNFAEKMLQHQGLVILNRFDNNQVHIFEYLGKKYGTKFVAEHVCFSLGVNDIDYNLFESFTKIGGKLFCVDVAHGHSKKVVNMVENIKKSNRAQILIAGNVATPEAAILLWNAGVDVVKVGIGPGKICTTRLETGCGYPQLSALSDINDIKSCYKVRFGDKMMIADGGIKSPGDCVKALCFADMVMAGSIFAHAIEAAGEVVVIDGIAYKKYSGSSTHKNSRIEGRIVYEELNDCVDDIMKRYHESIQSGLSYLGVQELSQLNESKPVFVEISTLQGQNDFSKETLRLTREQIQKKI